ncbi:MAG: YbhB/YbcL family Raf kinase inhibitor-like protein [Deltaproteobacteria bacterium]|nr:YbhB/YbcL family Raf kinase inhibitor-like protein [Deltaproteobacteria bacterium]
MLLLSGCESVSRAETPAQRPAFTVAMAEGENMRIVSSSFVEGGAIPARHTCMGADVSVPLAWTDVPAGTRSFALIIDDPDAPDPRHPQMVWVHWVLYNIPPDTLSLPEGIVELPAGTLEGLNDWHQTGYRGPCPPVGRHRYFHKLYALDTELSDLETPTKSELLRAITGHVIAETALMGTFAKK